MEAAVPSFADGATTVAAWRAALAGSAEPTLVDPDAAGRAPDLPQQARLELSAELTAALAGVAREQCATLGTLLRLAWAVVLGQLTGREDVTFGAVVSGRPAELPGVESMVGLFINTVPVRAAVPAGTIAADALRSVGPAGVAARLPPPRSQRSGRGRSERRSW